MSIVQTSFPFDISNGFGVTLRRWVGTITWTRDLTTQIVEMHVLADRVEGDSPQGLFVYWAPDLPVELRPEDEIYPSLQGSDSLVSPDGTGYSYIYDAPTHVEDTFRYVTGAPVMEPEEPPTDSLLDDINVPLLAAGLTVHNGYAPTAAMLPYTVHRPLVLADVEVAIAGNATLWDTQTTLYACAASVEASFNLAVLLMTALQGARVRGTTLSASMGYSGAQVEGHYESQVTVQLNQGGI